jgi:hypothetical protein
MKDNLENTSNFVDVEVKSAWERPDFERMDVAKSELGLLTGGDEIIIGTES